MAPLDSVGDSVNLCVGRKRQPLDFKLKCSYSVIQKFCFEVYFLEKE